MCPLLRQVQQACHRKMLLVRGGQAQGQGHWPIPEAYWPDPTHQGVSPREPHPMIAYKPVDADPHIPTNFIFDKYEASFCFTCVTGSPSFFCRAHSIRQLFTFFPLVRLVYDYRSRSTHWQGWMSWISVLLQIESNPIMGFLMKANAGACWQVFVRNSKGTNHGYGDPFG